LPRCRRCAPLRNRVRDAHAGRGAGPSIRHERAGWTPAQSSRTCAVTHLGKGAMKSPFSVLQSTNAFVFAGETSYAPPAGQIFKQPDNERRNNATTTKP